MDSKEPLSKQTEESSHNETERPQTSQEPDNSSGPVMVPAELLRMLIERESRPAKAPSIANSPLIVAFVGIAGIMVGALLNAGIGLGQKLIDLRMGAQQQGVVRRQKISDEIDKLRMQKMGEVWERLDEDEFAINNLLEESKAEGKDGPSDLNNTGRATEITKLINNDQAMLSKYRFWLGEDQFRKAGVYLKTNIRYSLSELGAKPDSDTTELKKRERMQN